MPEKHIGKVVQVMGPVLDIRFRDGELPALLTVSYTHLTLPTNSRV